MEPTLSSETSAFKLQTPGKFPKEHRLHSKHGESLKTTIPVMPNELHFMPSMAGFNTIDTNGVALGRVARLASIEVVHRERRVAGDLV